MTKLLGIDTGGTYTDAVLFDEADGVVASAKALTTKHDLAIGIRAAAEAVLAQADGEIGLVSLSTTLATNAMVEGQGGRVCLLLIGYEPEALDRASLRDAVGQDPVVFIAGGHKPLGEEQAPLDLAAARAAILDHRDQVAAFAVTGYFAVRNGSHELAVRDLVRELTDRPVTCGHELSSNLDAPRRALTTVLNARLIPLLQQLILAARDFLDSKGLAPPLMVVKGDGSLISAEAALSRPIETILSGPAASVVGGRYLAGEDDFIVSDMGGTTTDVAVVRAGRPVLNRDGATVGGWRTMVEAVAVHTVGLGGDSEVHLDPERGLVLGPRRVLPLGLLADQYPVVLPVLETSLERAGRLTRPGCFALRLRELDTVAHNLRPAEQALWDALADGPQPLDKLVTDYLSDRAVDKLVARGLIITAGFTPSDAAHVLGLHSGWSVDAARLGARIWARLVAASGIALPAQGEDDEARTTALCQAVVEGVTRQTGRALIEAALAADRDQRQGAVTGAGLGGYLVDRGLAPVASAADTQPLLDVALSLTQPLVAIGAPAATYYPAVAERLNTRLCVPLHAEVCNAVGAVASGVMQAVRLLISAPKQGAFRLHLPEGVRDFNDLDEAADIAAQEAARMAEARARDAGAGEISVRTERRDQIAQGPGDMETFIEATVTATAVGRPRIAAG